MKIALVSGNPHLPQLFGGVEINTHELALELLAAGHEVSVVVKLSLRTRFGITRALSALLTRQPVQIDSGCGYLVYRSLRPWERVTELPRFDVAVIQNAEMIEFGARFAELGTPSVAYFFGLPFEEDWARHYAQDPSLLPFRSYLSLSNYIAERFKQTYGLDSVVVPPILRRERYATETSRREVTFINPVPVKGVDLALSIARLCPEIPFGFVLGWPQGVRQLARLERAIKELPNVRLKPRASDMRSVYCETKILLVPSQWQAETWGRVASEAHCSGIPVIASNRGGLPEAVGPGGMILPFDAPASTWAAAVRTLWHDAAKYRDLSEAAARYAERPSLAPAAQARALVAELEKVVPPGNPRNRKVNGVYSAGRGLSV